jgi:membrane associated rhomboid family serine protease
MLVVFVYGSMVWGLFPYDWTISHESHISGAIIGFFLSIFFKKQKASFKETKTQWEIEEELGIDDDSLDGIWNEEIKD